MINKTGADHSRSIGAGHFDALRSPDKTGKAQKTQGPDAGFGLNSAHGSLTGAIDQMAQQGMPVDMQHVTAIRRAIADGQYPVDSVAIADSMIAFDRSGSGF